MTYYEYLLPNQNHGLIMLKRAFLLMAAFNFVTGLAAGIVAAIINWVFVFVPLVWFLLGFVYGNIAYLFVTDYKYVYDNGTFAIYKHRKYGKYRLVMQAAVADLDWDIATYSKQKQCTNTAATTKFVCQDVLYFVTVDDYMQSILKGEINVSR